MEDNMKLKQKIQKILQKKKRKETTKKLPKVVMPDDVEAEKASLFDI